MGAPTAEAQAGSPRVPVAPRQAAPASPGMIAGVPLAGIIAAQPRIGVGAASTGGSRTAPPPVFPTGSTGAGLPPSAPWWNRMGISGSSAPRRPRPRGFRLDPAFKLGSRSLRIRNPSLGHGVLFGLVPSLNADSRFGFRLETAFSRLYLPAGEAQLDHEGWAWSLGTGFGLQVSDPVSIDVRALKSYHLSVNTALPVEEDAWTFTTALSFQLPGG